MATTANRYKGFSIAFSVEEYEKAKAFFSRFGGFSKFVRTEMEKEGYTADDDPLVAAARKIRDASREEYDALEGTLGDGL